MNPIREQARRRLVTVAAALALAGVMVGVRLVSVGLLLGTGSIAFAIVRQSFLDLGAVMRRAIQRPSITARAAIGVRHEPSRAARKARSAVTQIADGR